jgi:hypothetical protein
MLDDAGSTPGANRTPSPTSPDRRTEPGGRESSASPLRRQGILLAFGAVVLVIIVAGLAVGLTRGAGIGGESAPVGSAPPPSLGPQPAAPFFAPVMANGQPPTDVMDALAVPTGASATSTSNFDRGGGPYDRGVSFRAPASVDQLLNFFRFELAANHWSNRTEAPARGGPGTQVLARHKSNDGFYWEVGVTVRQSPWQPSSAISANQFDIRLLQSTEG